MQHFLASRQAVDIPIKHLFIEYKFWIDRKQPFATVRDELATLAKQSIEFRRLIQPKKSDSLFPIATFLQRFDMSTAYPLLLFLLDANLDHAEWAAISSILESYILRRAVCNLTTKNYNRIFLTLTRQLHRDGASSANISAYLSDLRGDSVEWPTDDAFAAAWRSQHAYQILNNAKIVHILSRLSDTYINSKSEHITIDSPLTVEHILPQKWIENWPLPDGSQGMTTWEAYQGDSDDPIAEATRRRNALLQTLGNLTLLVQPLNSSVSNASWAVKKPQLMQNSLLPINQQLHSVEAWDEDAIEQRSFELFAQAVGIWHAPSPR
jgi:hypothetical protein